MIAAILLCVLGVLTLSLPYMCWRGSRNIVGLRELAFGILAFGFPLMRLALGFDAGLSGEVASNLEAACILGICGMLAGLFFGRLRLPYLLRAAERWLHRLTATDNVVQDRLTITILPLAMAATLILLFDLIGFIPAFAEDPLSAKFFRGQYGELYRPYALPYRFVTTLLPLTMIIAVALSRRQRWLSGLGLLSGTAALSLALARQPALLAIQSVGLAELVRRGWRRFSILLVALAAVLVAAVGGGIVTRTQSLESTLVERITAQAPDFQDQVSVITRYDPADDLTLGRTVIGGLTPFNSEWNPAIWSLRIINGDQTDITEIPSGGVRVLPSLWGYYSFGLAGAFAFGFLHGIITRWAVRLYRSIVVGNPRSLMRELLGIVIWEGVLGVLYKWYTLSLYTILPAIATIGILQYGSARRRKAADLHSELAEGGE